LLNEPDGLLATSNTHLILVVTSYIEFTIETCHPKCEEVVLDFNPKM
jgi:hypothetical protein